MDFQFAEGDRVRVKAMFPPGHVRTPYYARGKTGVVTARRGHFRNPEDLAYGRSGLPPIPLYGVMFEATELWENAPSRDRLVMDIFEHWLEPA
jgi:nitrile hydratase